MNNNISINRRVGNVLTKLNELNTKSFMCGGLFFTIVFSIICPDTIIHKTIGITTETFVFTYILLKAK